MYLKILSLTQKTSIRLRLTLLFVFIFGTSLAAFGFFTYRYLSSTLQQEFDDALFNYAVDVTESVILDPSGDLSLIPAQLDRLKIYPFSLGTALIQIRHRNGKVLEQVGDFGQLELPYKLELEKLASGEEAVFRTLDHLDGLPSKEANSYRMVTFAVDTSPIPQLVLQIAVPLSLLEKQIANRKDAFLFGIPLILILATLTAYLLSTRALKPITEMISKSQKIGAEDLTERLPIPKARDEVQNLALTLNLMLDRLQQSVQGHERFVADASHQMLTPLTILKGEIEQSKRNGKAEEKELNSLLQEVDRLSQLVKGLLILARVDAGRTQIQFQPLFFDELLIEAIGPAEKIARQKNIRIQFNIHRDADVERCEFMGAEDLLFHMVFNLIENAIKYSPENSTVWVDFIETTRSWHLKVTDSGPGIAEDEMKIIFERFHRGRPKNQQSQSGHGLGLAIVRKIALVHGAKIWIESPVNSSTSASGSCFHVEIKKD